jgi:hypothetical protein
MSKIQIIVNGTKTDFNKKTITYEEVAKLAYGVNHRDDYSMTYAKGFAPKTGGIMSKGDKVKVKSGMCFNAHLTGNA